jgi:hypothetical protein
MLSSATMRAVCDDATFLQNMLDFEAALARAEAATGVISPAAASTGRPTAAFAEKFPNVLDAGTLFGRLHGNAHGLDIVKPELRNAVDLVQSVTLAGWQTRREYGFVGRLA